MAYAKLILPVPFFNSDSKILISFMIKKLPININSKMYSLVHITLDTFKFSIFSQLTEFHCAKMAPLPKTK